MSSAMLFMSGRNCARYLERSIGSAARQSHGELHVLFVDDASSDGTEALARRLLGQSFPGRHTFVRNASPFGKARNAFEHLPSAPASTFVAVLDADDELLDDGIIGELAASYDEGFDVVWTNYATDQGTRGTNGPLDPFLSPRQQRWRSSHLFSFRRALFEAVPESYLKDTDGRWFTAACDFAIAYPVLDQTRRWRFIPKDAYRYTMSNPASHHNVHGAVGVQQGSSMTSASSALQAMNAEAVLAKAPLPCTRPLSGCPAAWDEALATLWGDARGRLARIERGLELMVQARARLPVDLLAAEGLSKDESVPLHWLGGAGGWSTDLELLHHLRGVLDRFPAPRVLEFGSGASSKILAKLCANRGGRLVSVEHDPVWFERTMREHADAGLDEVATVRLAPLVDVEFLGLKTRFYDMSWLTPADRFDVVLVDGPPSEHGRLVRLSGLPVVAGHLSDDFRLYLDDFERDDEKKVAEIWQKVAPDLKFRTLRFNKEVCEVAPR
jgi:predicted O-methyltransferase YrrM